jgi:hypothetical protein
VRCQTSHDLSEPIESSNSFREFETFADNLANLGADIIDIYMIYIYMSRAVWWNATPAF